MTKYILTTDLTAYESALKELTLWNRLKMYFRNNGHAIAAAIVGTVEEK